VAPLIILAAALKHGVLAVWSNRSEEEPQIIVPMIDIQVSMPGATPKEVENRVIGPMEKSSGRFRAWSTSIPRPPTARP